MSDDQIVPIGDTAQEDAMATVEIDDDEVPMEWSVAFDTPPDIVKHPAHYTKWKIQPRDFVDTNDLSFWQGNVIKYIMRAGDKLYEGLDSYDSKVLDLHKAQESIQHHLRQMEKDRS